MAVKTWYIRQINVGGTNPNRLWWDGSPAAGLVTQATSSTGWTVGATAANNYASLNQGFEVARTTFAATVLPNATAPNVDNNYPATAIYTPPTLLNSTDSISTLYEYNGSFPAGNWVFTFPVIAVTAGTTHDGAITMRVFKGLRSGTTWASVTELTTALLQGTTAADITTTVVKNSVVTWAAPAFRLNNEFLICKIAWRVIGAGGGNTHDALLRHGAGCTMVSPTFRKRSYNIT
jgi:hypothetical protein